jgi:hypothetical protein
VANYLIKFKRNIFKSSSNTFFLASLVYLRWQEILPLFVNNRNLLSHLKNELG